MKILDILSAPWAIEPSKLLELQSIYATHLRGDKIDVAAVEARLGRPLANEAKTYDVQDGVAVIPVEGVIAKKMNLFSQISGGVSTQLLAQNITDAMNDPAVHSVIMLVDSPGGTVDGTQALADIIFNSRDKKPVVTLASGTMASAGYWIGSAAQQVYIADATTAVGSIGVVTSHKDISVAEAAQGIKTTEISAGKYKRIASQYGPLSKEGRQSIQDQLDYTYSLFVSAVAKNRGVSADQVVADMADGRMFIGQQAVDAGLVDGIITLDNLVKKLNVERGQGASIMSAQAAQSLPKKGNFIMPENTVSATPTAASIAAQYPEVAQAFRIEGATAERERIASIEGQLIAGHEALIQTLKFDGKSTAGDAAQAVLAAEKTLRTNHAVALANDAPAPFKAAPIATVEAAAPTELSRAEMDKKAKELVALNPGMDYVTAFKQVEQGV